MAWPNSLGHPKLGAMKETEPPPVDYMFPDPDNPGQFVRYTVVYDDDPPNKQDLRQQMRSAIDPLARFGIKDPEDVLLGGATMGMYGEPGAGKTTVAATAIDYYKRVSSPNVKTLILEAEGGLTPIRSRRDFRWDPIYSWKEFCEVTDALVQVPNLREIHPVIQIDNLSEFVEMSMRDVLGKNKDEPEWQDWRKNSRVVVTRIRKLRDAARQLGVFVIINLWNREDTDTDGRVRKVTVELNPALAKVFLACVDIAAFLEVADDDGRRVLHLGQNSRVKSKFRQDVQDPIMMGIPHDLYGPPSSQGVLSLAPLVATLVGGEPFPANDFAIPESLKPSRFASTQATKAAAAVSPSPNGSGSGSGDETPAERKRRERREAAAQAAGN